MQRHENTNQLADLYARLAEIDRAIQALERVREIRGRRGLTAAEISAAMRR